MTPSAHKSEIAIAYDQWAETYDTDFNRTRNLAAQVLRQTDLQVHGREVIEVGCGTGHNTEWLAKRASRIVALDFSKGMLLRAKLESIMRAHGSSATMFARRGLFPMLQRICLLRCWFWSTSKTWIPFLLKPPAP